MQQGSKRPTFMVPRSTTDIRILWFSKAVLGPLKLVRHPEAPATVPRVRPGPSTPMTAQDHCVPPMTHHWGSPLR